MLAFQLAIGSPSRLRQRSSCIRSHEIQRASRSWKSLAARQLQMCQHHDTKPDHERISRRELMINSLTLATLGLAMASQPARADPSSEGYETAIVAGGCFWCTESDLEKVKGVISVTSGYCGGTEPNPSYELVSRGKTNHAESVSVVFDPKLISYEKLLDVYFHTINPTTRDQQFCDHGHQYRTAIFYLNDEQRKIAESLKDKYQQTAFKGQKVVTEIVPATTFWRAEEYHQDYYKKQPQLYSFYRFNCGRDQYLEKKWGTKHDAVYEQAKGHSFNVFDVPGAVFQRLNRGF